MGFYKFDLNKAITNSTKTLNMFSTKHGCTSEEFILY